MCCARAHIDASSACVMPIIHNRVYAFRPNLVLRIERVPDALRFEAAARIGIDHSVAARGQPSRPGGLATLVVRCLAEHYWEPAVARGPKDVDGQFHAIAQVGPSRCATLTTHAPPRNTGPDRAAEPADTGKQRSQPTPRATSAVRVSVAGSWFVLPDRGLQTGVRLCFSLRRPWPIWRGSAATALAADAVRARRRAGQRNRPAAADRRSGAPV